MDEQHNKEKEEQNRARLEEQFKRAEETMLGNTGLWKSGSILDQLKLFQNPGNN